MGLVGVHLFPSFATASVLELGFRLRIMTPLGTSVAGETPTSISHFIRIGGVSLEFRCDFVRFVIPRGLHPFKVRGAMPDISIDVEWLGGDLRPTTEKVAFDSGCTWKVHDLGPDLQFDFYSGASQEKPYKRLVTDKRFTVANLQMSEEAKVSLGVARVPLDYPLDELLVMHRLTQEKAIELHGTGIVRPNGEANLFVGHSGAGKSTTTRLWTAVEDVEVLSDDRIIVRRDEHASRAPSPSLGISSRGSDAAQTPQLRLRDQCASYPSRSAQDDNAQKQVPHPGFAGVRNDMGSNASFARNDIGKKLRMYGTPWHGEAMYASPNSAPLARIFVLEHGHGNVITPLTPSAAVAELFARSFVPFHRHEYVESALEFLQEVVDAVPVYRYAFEPDQRAVETILNFHD